MLGFWSIRCRLRSIAAQAERWKALPDLELLRASRRLQSVARERSLTRAEIDTAVALVRDAARRVHGTPHYPVQLWAGLAMCGNSAVEMETGEGKTLTALIPAFMAALDGAGCHVLTANDYLAERDCRHAQPVLDLLGLTVGWIGQSSPAIQRRQAYAADVTYTTVTQTGFDLLRDLAGQTTNEAGPRTAAPVQRPLSSVVVDEADLIMLDEARTPLLLAVAEPHPESLKQECTWAAKVAESLALDVDFELAPRAKTACLTERGCRRVLLASSPGVARRMTSEIAFRTVERALEARHAYHCDRDYLVRDGKVAILGATTGRVLNGRQWQNGLQPAIEFKEGVAFSPQTRSNGCITVQTLLNRYDRHSGMSGTLTGARSELAHVYGLGTSRVPPRLPCRRRPETPRCFLTMDAKLRAIAADVEQQQRQGRPVLVGTPSLETSERLASLLEDRGLVHELLTARQPEREAEIVQHAGEPGRITIATNMAGRGTDIRITDDVRRAGGLHVIVAGLQASPRTDRQLIGRTARQGDPGSYQVFVSYDDEMLTQWRPDVAERWKRSTPSNRSGETSRRVLARFLRAQRELDRLHSDQRRQLHRQQSETDTWASSVGLDPLVEWLDDERHAA